MTFTNKLLVLNKRRDVAKKCAEIFVEAVKNKPDIVLGLPTGKTFVPIYHEIVKLCKKEKVSLAKVRTFNLDEFFGLKSGDKKSFRHYMDKNFFDKVDIARKNIFFLNGDVGDFKKECDDYEQEIRKAGGIDLQFLGIGVNGHIGFNEPGSVFTSRTRRVELTKSTREENASEFGSAAKVPQFALTVGIGTVLKSRKIVLAATGKTKSQIIEEVVCGKISKKIPASALRKHKDVCFLLDKDAASRV